MVLAGLKTKLIAAAGVLIAVLGWLLKIFVGRARKEKASRQRAESALERQSDIYEADTELDREHKIRVEGIENEVKEGSSPRELTEPDDWDEQY